jgi:hypothetical protein
VDFALIATPEDTVTETGAVMILLVGSGLFERSRSGFL